MASKRTRKPSAQLYHRCSDDDMKKPRRRPTNTLRKVLIFANRSILIFAGSGTRQSERRRQRQRKLAASRRGPKPLPYQDGVLNSPDCRNPGERVDIIVCVILAVQLFCQQSALRRPECGLLRRSFRSLSRTLQIGVIDRVVNGKAHCRSRT